MKDFNIKAFLFIVAAALFQLWFVAYLAKAISFTYDDWRWFPWEATKFSMRCLIPFLAYYIVTRDNIKK